MIIKKFQGNTETEAIMLAQEELGKDAIVMNVKKIMPRGLSRLFKKTVFEITAALDETPPHTETSRKESLRALFKNNPDIICEPEEEQTGKKSGQDILKQSVNNTTALEIKLNNLTSILEKQMGEKLKETPEKEDGKQTAEADKNMACIQLIYNQLINNEVDEKYINQVISEIEPTLKKDSSVDNVLSSIYQKIVLKLGRTEILEVSPGKTKFIFFIGPTGVGKTTTIAKLASTLKLKKKLNIALLTADTYRIAAVEQLHTYANILGIPLKVVYSAAEMGEAREELNGYDIVLVDTAGRSHRSKEQKKDIEDLIASIPEASREIFLVLSVTTKYRDLIKITEAYSEVTKYRLIFTKLDETNSIGNIFNIKLLTGAPLSYATFGQNVPDDISRIDAQTIAKQLLGGNE